MAEEVDKSIKKLIRSCINRNHRSLFTLLGSKVSEQVPVFVELLKQRKVKEISCLWCNSGEISVKNVQANLHHKLSEDNNPEPYFCQYSNIEEISHRSFNLVVLQDFASVTAEILSTVTSTVKGGGIIIFLLPEIKSLDDLSEITMNVPFKPSRFCKRFVALLKTCPDSMILDQNLTVLSRGTKVSENLEEDSSSHLEKIEELKQNFEKDVIVKNLLGLCHTSDQAELVVNFLDALKKKTPNSVYSVSSAVGRGKSAALGLAIAGGLAYNYSNIFITSMNYNNVKLVFKFLLLGLEALEYEEEKDFDLIESTDPNLGKVVIGVNLFKDHPQSVRFILPGDIGQAFDQAELVIFDEAAGIPPQILKPLFGPYVVLMASSTSGPGCSSPYLYNSMINTLQKKFAHPHESEKFVEISLTEPINYNTEDHIESWVGNLLQVDPSLTSILSCGYPVPDECQLFYVNRDVLFNGSSLAENFLKSLTSVLSSSERVIYPNQLLDFADSPDHYIFCLLPPLKTSSKVFTGIITVILVHIENYIPENIVHLGTNLNDIESHCFNQWKEQNTLNGPKFLPVKGVHVVKIVTHQSYRKMGYGTRAFQLLQEFYEGKCISLDENSSQNIVENEESMDVDTESNMESPLLLQLTEARPDDVNYILATCTLTTPSLKFWKKAAFIPVFITDKKNSEDDHFLYMAKSIKDFDSNLKKYWASFQKHFFVLLGSAFKYFPATLALNLVSFNVDSSIEITSGLTKEHIDVLIKPHRMKSLLKYCQNLQEFHSVLQFIPILSNLYFKNNLKDLSLSRVQEAILLSFGLQFKIADEISKDLGLPNMQIHGLLNRCLKKIVKYVNDILEKTVEKSLVNPDVVMEPVAQDLNEELEEAAKKIREQQETEAKKLLDMDLAKYAIKGSEDEWQKALFSGRKTLVSIKSIKTTLEKSEKVDGSQQHSKKGKKHKKFRK